MIPAFKYLKIPYSLRIILKKNLRDSSRDEQFISEVINSDKALVLLIQKYLGYKLKDRSMAGVYRYYGWDLFRKSLLSVFITRSVQGTWPTVSVDLPSIDKEYNLLEEELSIFSAKGSYRHSLLALYLRLLEAKLSNEFLGEKLLLCQHCLKTLPLFAIKNRKEERSDLGALIFWHFLEYFKEEHITQAIRAGESYESLSRRLPASSFKIMTDNICTYLYSIGDQEQLQFEVVV